VSLRILCTAICSIAISAAAPAAAMAGSGGVSAPGGANAPPASPKKHIVYAPTTSRSTNIHYGGPVYVRTSSGRIVRFSTANGSKPTASTGGATYGDSTKGGGLPQLVVPGIRARYIVYKGKGLAAAPEGAPMSVQKMIWAGNHLIGKPYIYGGGHASFYSRGYDCSGTVSFALHGGGMLRSPMDSSEFESYGWHGIGRWVTIFANPSHAYMTIAGLRLDTNPAFDPSNLEGPRWRPLRPENSGYVRRHPTNL